MSPHAQHRHQQQQQQQQEQQQQPDQQQPQQQQQQPPELWAAYDPQACPTAVANMRSVYLLLPGPCPAAVAQSSVEFPRQHVPGLHAAAACACLHASGPASGPKQASLQLHHLWPNNKADACAQP